jgi:hypothetical protein
MGVFEKNVVKFSTLLSYAGTIGIDWNTAHKSLVDDDVPPMHGNTISCIDMEDAFDPELSDYSEDTIRILKGFMEKHNVTEINIIG